MSLKHIIPILSLFVFITSYNTKAQNLVLNGNFETYTNCPTTFSQIDSAIPWKRYHSATSDFFHSCNKVSVGVPNNFAGYQHAANGNGYSGLYFFSSVSAPSAYTEYIAAPITPMVIGVTYEVSMLVSRSNNSRCACSGMGVWFYDVGRPIPTSGSGTLNVTPQVHYLSYGAVTDTQGWTRMTAFFTADSAYDNIVIGKFNPSTGLTIIGTAGYAYYYIDSVVVRTSTTALIYPDSMLCAGDTFNVPYTLVNPASFASNNILTIQLSNPTGSFTSGTLNIGTRTSNTSGSIACYIPASVIPGTNYRIRILSSNPVDSFVAGYPISIGNVHVTKPVATSSTPACSGQTLNLYANSSTSGVSYKWKGPGGFYSSVQNPVISSAATTNSGAYIVTAYLFGCYAIDTTNIIVNQMPTAIFASSTSPICTPNPLILNCTNSSLGATYTWTGPGGYTSSVQNPFRTPSTTNMSGTYVVTASLGTSCVRKDSVTVVVNPGPANTRLISNNPVCTDKALRIVASSSSGGTTYSWVGPGGFTSLLDSVIIPQATSAHAGYYIVTYQLGSCSIKDSVMILVNEGPLAVRASTNAPICEPATLQLRTNDNKPGATYTWTGPGSFSSNFQNTDRQNTVPSMSGVYVIKVSMGNGCIESDSLYAAVNPSPQNFFSNSDTVVCLGDTLSLFAGSGSNAISYHWTGPGVNRKDSTVLITNFSKNNAGKYIATATLGNCAVSDSFLAVLIDPKFDLGGDKTLCLGETLLLAPGIEQASYLWQDGSTSKEFNVKQRGLYSVELNTICGTLSDSIKVEYEECECKPFVPTAFTPNSDGRNDKLVPIINCIISSYKFLVVNRFGEAVFSSNNSKEKWDGMFRGQPAEVGTYYYLLQIKGPLDKDYLFKGDITLIR